MALTCGLGPLPCPGSGGRCSVCTREGPGRSGPVRARGTELCQGAVQHRPSPTNSLNEVLRLLGGVPPICQAGLFSVRAVRVEPVNAGVRVRQDEEHGELEHMTVARDLPPGKDSTGIAAPPPSRRSAGLRERSRGAADPCHVVRRSRQRRNFRRRLFTTAVIVDHARVIGDGVRLRVPRAVRLPQCGRAHLGPHQQLEHERPIAIHRRHAQPRPRQRPDTAPLIHRLRAYRSPTSIGQPLT
jgi:hypothetical protein